MGFDFLGSEQTLFSNPGALDPDFVPKKLPHREGQQEYIATAIKPLFHNRNGKTLLISGAPGIGKTAATRRVLMDLAEVESDKKVKSIFLNCWKLNTTYKVLCEISKQIGFPFTQNLKTDQVMAKIRKKASKFDGVVFAFDEIDKADDYDFLYFILEEFSKKTLILITNEEHWGAELDDRIRSRLVPETLEFKAYSPKEIFDILKQRKKYAFYQGSWQSEAFEKLAEEASKYKDIRIGIRLLKVAGEEAELSSSKKVLKTHVSGAISKIEDFKIKSSADLTDEEKHVLSVCKQNSGKPSSSVFSAYQDSGGAKSRRTFKRKLEKLKSKKLIVLDRDVKGSKGRPTVVKYLGLNQRNSKQKVKGLDEF